MPSGNELNNNDLTFASKLQQLKPVIQLPGSELFLQLGIAKGKQTLKFWKYTTLIFGLMLCASVSFIAWHFTNHESVVQIHYITDAHLQDEELPPAVSQPENPQIDKGNESSNDSSLYAFAIVDPDFINAIATRNSRIDELLITKKSNDANDNIAFNNNTQRLPMQTLSVNSSRQYFILP